MDDSLSFELWSANHFHSKIAEHIASAAHPSRMVLVDAFAGAGGNTIAFARSGRWKRVYGIEKNPAVLLCAKHNAKIYGVEDKITWFEGDSLQIVNNQLKDLGPYSVLFASPPWGGMFSIPLIDDFEGAYTYTGPGYRSDKVFNLSTMEPYSLTTLYNEYALFTEHVVLYLPRTSNVKQLAKLVKDGEKATVMHYCMEGASKALCIYYGGFNLQ